MCAGLLPAFVQLSHPNGLSSIPGPGVACLPPVVHGISACPARARRDWLDTAALARLLRNLPHTVHLLNRHRLPSGVVDWPGTAWPKHKAAFYMGHTNHRAFVAIPNLD